MRHAADHTLFNDLLTELNVPHTDDFSKAQFDAMPFKSLFGLSRLLERYGIDSEGAALADKSDITRLTPPFVASTAEGFVIVRSINGPTAEYLTAGVRQQIPTDELVKACDGTVFLAYPKPDAVEPDYSVHRRDMLIKQGKNALLLALTAFLILYLFFSNGLYKSWSAVGIALLDIGGLYITWLLLQKTLRIHSRAADSMCRLIEEGGCDSVLETPAAKFFGIFSWSEVGFTYFSVSLITLLVFPHYLPSLALCNLCCLPF